MSVESAAAILVGAVAFVGTILAIVWGIRKQMVLSRAARDDEVRKEGLLTNKVEKLHERVDEIKKTSAVHEGTILEIKQYAKKVSDTLDELTRQRAINIPVEVEKANSIEILLDNCDDPECREAAKRLRDARATASTNLSRL